jgi:PKD repeat protein
MNSFSKLIVAPAFKVRIIFYLLQITACDLPVVEPINPNPTSKFVYSVEDASCTSNCNVSFTNQSVNAESYEWNFGDGTPVSNTLNPVHTYASPGTYNVSLKAMNDVAEHDTTISVVLGSGSTGAEPAACFTISNNNCTAPCTVTFTNCSTNATAWEWNFGDGSAVATTENASHLFSTAGSFEVSLTATNESGSHSITASVSILAAPELFAITHNANASNISAQRTRIDHELTDNSPAKILVVTPLLGAYNDAAVGVYYYANHWHIFNEDVSSIVDGEKFNVLISDADDSYAFVHRTSPANIRDGYISTIDHPATNNNANARIFVTPVWEKISDYNVHPVGVAYINNRWEIFNLNAAPLPSDLRFNVIVSTNDQESFVHSSTSTSVVSNYTMIDDPRTNTKNGLKLFATLNQGTIMSPIINPGPTGVWYREAYGMWTVFNENYTAMPQGARYNILAVD